VERAGGGLTAAAALATASGRCGSSRRFGCWA